jgi:hypothetical protein
MENETINLDFNRLSWEQQERLRKAKIGEPVDCGDVWVVKLRDNGGCQECCFVINEKCTKEKAHNPMMFCATNLGIWGNLTAIPKIPEHLREAVQEFEEREGCKIVEVKEQRQTKEIPNQIPQYVIDAANAALAQGNAKYGDTTAESVGKKIAAYDGDAAKALTYELAAMIGHATKIMRGERIDPDTGQPHINFVISRGVIAAMILKRMGE